MTQRFVWNKFCCTLRLLFALPIALMITTAFVGCGRDAEPRQQVVLYTSLNEPTARAVIDAFEQETGVQVVVVA